MKSAGEPYARNGPVRFDEGRQGNACLLLYQNREKEGGDADGGGRKPGAQPGHRPNSRERAEPDWTEELPVHFAIEYLI